MPSLPFTQVEGTPQEGGQWAWAPENLAVMGIFALFRCPACKELLSFRWKTHRFVQQWDGTYVVTPSLRCTACRWHAFVEDSKIYRAEDAEDKTELPRDIERLGGYL